MKLSMATEEEAKTLTIDYKPRSLISRTGRSLKDLRNLKFRPGNTRNFFKAFRSDCLPCKWPKSQKTLKLVQYIRRFLFKKQSKII